VDQLWRGFKVGDKGGTTALLQSLIRVLVELVRRVAGGGRGRVNLGERGNAEDTAPPTGVLPTAGTGHGGRHLERRRLQRRCRGEFWRGTSRA
jgi:hypothetical protein